MGTRLVKLAISMGIVLGCWMSQAQAQSKPAFLKMFRQKEGSAGLS